MIQCLTDIHWDLSTFSRFNRQFWLTQSRAKKTEQRTQEGTKKTHKKKRNTRSDKKKEEGKRGHTHIFNLNLSGK